MPLCWLREEFECIQTSLLVRLGWLDELMSLPESNIGYRSDPRDKKCRATQEEFFTCLASPLSPQAEGS